MDRKGKFRFMMILIIFAMVFATVQGLHILPCEPGDPGPLGCAQFVANGGQLGTGQGVGAGQGEIFSQLETFGQSPGSLSTDPSFWTNPGLQQPNLVDPTQFLDPTSQFLDTTIQLLDPTTQLDPNLMFIDPTQLTSPALGGGFLPIQMEQTSGIVPPGVEFVGGKMVYPKKSIGSYPKGLLKKKLLGGYPKGMPGKMRGYPKGNLKKKILNSYPRGKLGLKGIYSKYPKFNKSYMGLKNYGYYPKSFKVLVYPKKIKKAGYYGYPKSWMKKKMGFSGYFPIGYPAFSKKYQKFLGGY